MGSKMSYGLNEMMDYDLDENILLYIYTALRYGGMDALIYFCPLRGMMEFAASLV